MYYDKKLRILKKFYYIMIIIVPILKLIFKNLYCPLNVYSRQC